MSANKWFYGVAGWMLGGPLGALLGYWIGSYFDNRAEEAADEAPNAQHDNFVFSLLVLTAAMIKADGRVMHSEMEYVRATFRRNFGDEAATQASDILRTLVKQDIDVQGCCTQMAAHMNEGERLQLLAYLVGIARADGHLDEREAALLRQMCVWLGLALAELDSLLGMGGATADEAYKVLEVSPDASDEEVRRAYKRLVLKHHPDRVATLGDDVKRAAEEKLKLINEAYERIRAARGL